MTDIYILPFELDESVTREYGPIVTLPSLDLHEGMDWRKPLGTPVVASGAGVVSLVMHDTNEEGYSVWIVHDDERVTTGYCHLETEPLVSEGDRVEQGQVLGAVGASGAANGVHLHYEFLIRGIAWNPRTIAAKHREGLPSDF